MRLRHPAVTENDGTPGRCSERFPKSSSAVSKVNIRLKVGKFALTEKIHMDRLTFNSSRCIRNFFSRAYGDHIMFCGYPVSLQNILNRPTSAGHWPVEDYPHFGK